MTSSVRTRAEVVELIDEGKAELERGEPNSIKVTSVLMGIAGTVQTLGALHPAWQALKAAASALGIPMP